MSIEKISSLPDLRGTKTIAKHSDIKPANSVGEFLDNSIDGMRKAEMPEMDIDIEYDPDKKRLTITDNGPGMDETTMRNSARLCLSYKTSEDIGGYGIGMKNATCRLSSVEKGTLTLISKKKDSKKYTTKWGELAAEGEDEWTVNFLVEDDKSSWHGTVAIIDDVDSFEPVQFLREIHAFIGKRYAAYIRSGNVHFYAGIKGVKDGMTEVAAHERLLLEKSRVEFEHELPSGNKVKGWYGLAADPRQSTAGFGFHCGDRLIEEYMAAGYNHHSTYNAVIGCIHLHQIPVTPDKMHILRDSTEYKEFLDEFWGDITDGKPGLTNAGKPGLVHTILGTVKSVTKIAKPLTKDDAEKLTAWVNKAIKLEGLDLLLGTPEKVDGIKKIVKNNPNPKIRPHNINPNPNPDKPHRPHVRRILIDGKLLKFDWKAEEVMHESIDRRVSIDDKFITISINPAHPSFAICKDRKYYIANQIADGLTGLAAAVHKWELEELFSYKSTFIASIMKNESEEVSL